MWVQVEMDALIFFRGRTRARRFIYGPWSGISELFRFMGRQRPPPTTRRRKVMVLSTAFMNWSTHIVTPTSWLAIVGFVLLLMLGRIWVAEMQVVVWWVDKV